MRYLLVKYARRFCSISFDYGIFDTQNKLYYPDGRFSEYSSVCEIYDFKYAVTIYSALSGIPESEVVPLTAQSFEEIIKTEGDRK